MSQRPSKPIVRLHYPALKTGSEAEYRKMLELSTKMMVVGHACTEIAGHDYDHRRQRIACLFGACCFLADSFLDDFREAATRSYLQRLELLLTKGWFEVRNHRERLFEEKKESAIAFLKTLVAYYASLGVTVTRVMTDNGSCYCSREFATACRQLALRHIKTRPYTPRTNGRPSASFRPR